jgi:hypothetical protein
MATNKQDTLVNLYSHSVGTINSWKVRDIANGAIVASTPIDNYTIVELDFDTEGNRIAKQLSDVTKKQYLIASPERRYLGEDITEFYNGIGEKARIIVLDEGVRFETSAFSLNAGVTEVEKGNVAHFDPTSKKFIISKASSPHASYSNASTKFTVVGDIEDTAGNFILETVRLEVQ